MSEVECSAFDTALAYSGSPERCVDQTGSDVYGRCCNNTPNSSRDLGGRKVGDSRADTDPSQVVGDVGTSAGM